MTAFEHEHEHAHWSPHTHRHRHISEPTLAHERSGMGPHHHKHDAAALREHPDEPHQFRTTCLICGRYGMVNLSLITDDELVTITSRSAAPEDADVP